MQLIEVILFFGGVRIPISLYGFVQDNIISFRTCIACYILETVLAGLNGVKLPIATRAENVVWSRSFNVFLPIPCESIGLLKK